MLYEIHDPSAYLQPDVIADFSQVTLTQIAPNRVAVSGASGRAPTGQLKVSVAYRDGWLGEGQISYAGANARSRADLAAAILDQRLTQPEITERLTQVIGSETDLRLRYGARCADKPTASQVTQEVEALYLCGPAAGGGVTKTIKEIIAIASTLVPADAVPVRATLLEATDEAA